MAKTGNILERLRNGVLGEGAMEQPRTAELVAYLVEAFGGPKEVAKALFDEYQRKDCTSYTRSRIIGLLLDAMKFAESNTPDAFKDLGHVSDEDLERMLEQKLQTVTKGMASTSEEKGQG